MTLPWLLLLVIGLAAAPVGACVWWLVHSRREQERKQTAMAKMTRRYGAPDSEPVPQPMHALADGDDRPYGVRRHPASWPSGASHVEVPPRMQEPALSMIPTPASWTVDEPHRRAS